MGGMSLTNIAKLSSFKFFMQLVGAVFAISLLTAQVVSSNETEELQLTITGNIKSEKGAIYFSPGDMAASAPTDIVTSSPWTSGKTVFRGVLLRDILKSVDAQGTVLKASAVDGYTVEIPISDAEDFDMIIAYRLNGVALEKDVYGPFWIIYPYDSDEKLGQEKYHARSIWQLTKLVVE
jgi:hypothetical protein